MEPLNLSFSLLTDYLNEEAKKHFSNFNKINERELRHYILVEKNFKRTELQLRNNYSSIDNILQDNNITLEEYINKKLESLQTSYIKFFVIKKDGKFRTIYSPKKRLKFIQRVIARILSKVYLPLPNVYGFIKNRSFITNAKQHVNKRYILKIDIEDFFYSIKIKDIKKILYYNVGQEFYSLVSSKFGEFTYIGNNPLLNDVIYLTVHWHDGKYVLPQGSPTSPIISNIFMYDLDLILTVTSLFYPFKSYTIENKNTLSGLKDEIQKLFGYDLYDSLESLKKIRTLFLNFQDIDSIFKKIFLPKNIRGHSKINYYKMLLSFIRFVFYNFRKNNLIDYFFSKLNKSIAYTRYADDLIFSSNYFKIDKRFLFDVIYILNSYNLEINQNKIRFMNNQYRQVVTGLVVNKKLNVRRKFIKRIRLFIYFIEKYGLNKAQELFSNFYKKDKKLTALEYIPDIINYLHGCISFIKSVRGKDDPLVRKLEERLKKQIEIINNNGI